MKKLVVAGLLGLAAFTGLGTTAMAGPLLGFRVQQVQTAPQAPVILVQQGGDAVMIQQLQEEIRQLNGRVEEMSFQLLQMQEQMRKAQEDNEFRFQELEKSDASGGAKPAKQQDVASSSSAPSDDVAAIIGAPSDGGASNPPAQTTTGARPNAPGETTLGSILLDAQGMPIGGSLNSGADNSSASVAPQQTDVAALTNENDVYQAAYSHVLAGDYKSAETGFQSYVTRFPKGAKLADANFWLGEAQYSQGHFTDAAKTFLNAHQTFGKSNKAPEMLMKLGMSLAALDNNETACATLREVNKRYPSASKTVLGKVSSELKRLRC